VFDTKTMHIEVPAEAPELQSDPAKAPPTGAQPGAGSIPNEQEDAQQALERAMKGEPAPEAKPEAGKAPDKKK
jgi:hypothetical protein